MFLGTFSGACTISLLEMYTETLLDHFRNPRNVGELDPPAVIIEVSNPACGDILQLSARFEAGVVVQARYRVRGCTAAIAAGSALTEMILGLGRTELAALKAADVEARLGGLPAASGHAAALCVDGVNALLTAVQ